MRAVAQRHDTHARVMGAGEEERREAKGRKQKTIHCFSYTYYIELERWWFVFSPNRYRYDVFYMNLERILHEG